MSLTEIILDDGIVLDDGLAGGYVADSSVPVHV